MVSTSHNAYEPLEIGQPMSVEPILALAGAGLYLLA
jgi:hypothetical protein